LPIVLVACTSEAPPAAPATEQTAESKAQQLDKMYGEFWEETLKRNPIQATFVGDNRYNDQLPNFLSPAYRDESIAFDNKWIASFKAIDPSDLDGQARLSYDIMMRNLSLDLESYQFRTDLMLDSEVYADWLIERGEPQGELILFDVRRKRSGTTTDSPPPREAGRR